MGKQLIEKMLPSLNKMDLPKDPTATELGRKAYDEGLDKVDSYNGDPKILASALKVFSSGNSRPFACAGIAYTLIAASQEADGSYAPEGLEAAMAWLEKAQEGDPDNVQINMIEALVYIYGGELENARLVLDYLHEQDSMNYYLYVAEIAYWQKLEKLEETLEWLERAKESAVTVPQRLRLMAKMGDFYMKLKMMDKALDAYKNALKFDKQNAQMYHNIAIIYWKQENIDEAARFNQQTLKLADFPEARQLETQIKKKKSGSGVLGLFRRG